VLKNQHLWANLPTDYHIKRREAVLIGRFCPKPWVVFCEGSNQGFWVEPLKAQMGNWGEIKAAQRIGVEIIPLGQGFTWDSDNLAQDRALAQACWQQCRERIESDQYDIVIMDEITYAFKYGWLDLSEVLETLRKRNPLMHVILTGRDAPEELIEFADLVTEMREIKHPYKTQGILAQKGIEF
jgi:cob(I)alamin adenosyltransferase